MMTKAERIEREAWEKQRRYEVLNKIKYQKMLLDKNRVIKTFSQVKYVVGRYNPQNQRYQYRSHGGWSTILSQAITYGSPKVVEMPKNPKGCIYGTSKVFVKVISVYQKGQEDNARNHIDSISLTKPNHYEMLSAVINNI